MTEPSRAQPHDARPGKIAAVIARWLSRRAAEPRKSRSSRMYEPPAIGGLVAMGFRGGEQHAVQRLYGGHPAARLQLMDQEVQFFMHGRGIVIEAQGDLILVD